MKFDDIVCELGEFGRYQKRIYFWLCLPAITVGCFMMMNIILLATPQHRCRVPTINQSIPASADYKYDRCHLYSAWGVTYDIHDRPLNTSQQECQAWVYDKDTFTETFTSKHNFVCDEALKTSHAQLIFYCGVLAGDLGFGLLSDIVGRKKCFTIASVIQVAAAFGVAWSPNFLVYVILEFVVGAACHGVFMSSVVMGLELVGPSKRAWAGLVIHLFFTIGLCYLSGVSWLLRHWHHIQIAVAAPCALYLGYWWLISESPRWLLSVGRRDEAEKIIRRAAEYNGATLPDQLFDENTVAVQEGGKLWQLFTTRVLFIRTMIIFFNWIIVSMLYYGVTMYASRLSGDFYLNFFLLAVVEFPCFIVLPMMATIGRIRTNTIMMMLGGFACLGTMFAVIYGGEDLHPLTLALTLIGKLGPSGAFGVIYIISLEIYPTLLRNAGMGASSCVARFGGMAAPYIAKIGDTVGGDLGKALPLVIFGVAAIIAGLLCLLLPETLHQKLPDTIDEAKHFKGYKRKKQEKIDTVTVGVIANGYDSTKM